jgi:hypothetical protein
LLLAEDFQEQTIFHIAAERGDTQVLNKIWQWSTVKLSAEEVNEFLLAEDKLKKNRPILCSTEGRKEGDK